MASLDFACSLQQAFNFEKDKQVLVGHLVSISIGGQALTANITLTKPTDVATTEVVVGAISNISWAGGYADPVYISCNVTTTNQTATAVLTHTKMANTEVLFNFNIYAFDQVNKVYYPCFNSNNVSMKGLVLKHGGDLALSIDADPDMTVPSPLNYRLNIGVMPQQLAQTLHAAVSNTDKFTKTWGVAVS